MECKTSRTFFQYLFNKFVETQPSWFFEISSLESYVYAIHKLSVVNLFTVELVDHGES